jgi:L,D-transpeptidase ErfK/SrfK
VTLPKKFVLPGSSREGLVVNIAEYRLYHYYRQNCQQMVSTFPISIGRMDWSTPIGRWAVNSKQKDPTWYPPESIRKEHLEDGRGELAKAVPPGPDNPLGRYAMRLSASGYLIHGTNRPVGVGMQVTHGCIRMYPEDIEWLFPQIPVNTPVTIINQPYKFGWFGNDLYLEVHPPLDDDRLTRDREMTALTEQYVLLTRDRPARIDWQVVEEAYRRRDGIPVLVGSGLAPSGHAAEQTAAIL